MSFEIKSSDPANKNNHFLINCNNNLNHKLLKHIRNLSENVSMNNSLNIINLITNNNENNETLIKSSKISTKDDDNNNILDNESIEDVHFMLVKCLKKSKQIINSREGNFNPLNINKYTYNSNVIKYDRETDII